MSDELEFVSVQTKKCGVFSVYVQGNINDRRGKTFILTVHDVGTNHKSFVRFVNDASMVDVKAHAIFLHVCLPGQYDKAPDLVGEDGSPLLFPTLDELGEDLVCVLDKFDVKTCVAWGEGAGANIICRFAIEYPNRVYCICLVHCTSTTAGIIEYCKDKLINLQLESGVMSPTAWDYLAFHRFGSDDAIAKERYIEELKATLNPKNLSRFLYSFSKRTDLSSVLGTKLTNMDTLLVTGAKASHLHTVYTTHQSMDKQKTTLLVVDDVHDVMSEAPESLARSLILLCKGCGVLSGVGIPGMERQRTLSGSMEEADRPHRFSSTPQNVNPAT